MLKMNTTSMLSRINFTRMMAMKIVVVKIDKEIVTVEKVTTTIIGSYFHPCCIVVVAVMYTCTVNATMRN